MEPEPEPELKSVVIISLPPPENPSQGKTITAFTYSASSPPQHQPPNQNHHQVHHHHHHHHHHRRSPPPLSFPSPVKTLFALFVFALLAASLWAFLFSESPLQLLESSPDEKRDAESFLFPLYPKADNRNSLQEVGGLKLATSVKSSSAAAAKQINSSAVLPIRGNVYPDGQYYTSIFVGNPPRPYFLDVDTGSELTWIQCDAPCTSCAKGPHPLYKPTKGRIVPSRDSLCREVQTNLNNQHCESCQQCDYEIEYADHSSSMGVLARDEMHLILANNDRAKLSFVFGCAYDQQGQLLASPAKTDGILGLSSAKVSLPSQLASQGIINNVIGHCIADEANGGGYMFLGDDFVPSWGMTWIPTVYSLTNFYQTEVFKLSYGGERISMGAQGHEFGKVVFDTGSSYTYFTKDAYTKLIALLESSSNGLVRDDSDQTLPVCWRPNFPVRSLSDVKQFFEPLTLHFGKRWWIVPTMFTIPPEGYLIISNKGNICLGILDGSEVHDGSAIILGDISLRGKLVVYDNEQQKIGWVQSTCATKPERRTKDFPFFV